MEILKTISKDLQVRIGISRVEHLNHSWDEKKTKKKGIHKIYKYETVKFYKTI